MNERPHPTRDPDVVDRLARLRAILPLIATDLATARRHAHELETENRRLTRRVAELESKLTDTHPTTGPDASRQALPRSPNPTITKPLGRARRLVKPLDNFNRQTTSGSMSRGPNSGSGSGDG
jgi:hypothetical protein